MFPRSPFLDRDRCATVSCATGQGKRVQRTSKECRNERAPLEPAAIVQNKLVAAITEEATRGREHPRSAPAGILLDARHDFLNAVHFGVAVRGDIAQIFRAGRPGEMTSDEQIPRTAHPIAGDDIVAAVEWADDVCIGPELVGVSQYLLLPGA